MIRTMRTIAFITGLGLLCVVGSGPTSAAPEAALAAKTWQLDFAFHDPQRISIRMPGDAEETTFWYMMYVVTNHTGQDVAYYPSFSLVTDRLQTVDAGDQISPTVYDAIAARHKKDYPFFARPSKVTGLLLQGADNARTSVAVFRMFDKEVNRFSVFASGLSGDVARVANPAFDADNPESEKNKRYFVLRRTLAIVYDLPGDASTRGKATPIRRSREWVMR